MDLSSDLFRNAGAAGAISVWIIQRKLRQVSRSMFGTDSLLEGLEQQEERIAETPRSVSS